MHECVQWPFTWKRVGGTCFFAKWLCTWSTAFLEKDWNRKKEINRRVIQKCSCTSSLSLLYRGMSPSVTRAGPLRCFETNTDANTNNCAWVGSLITSSPQTPASINVVPHLNLLPRNRTKAALWRAVCCEPFHSVIPAKSKMTILLEQKFASCFNKHQF